jgi:hypothetical protein
MQTSGDQRRENAESYLKLKPRHCEEQSDGNRHCERSEAIHLAAQRKNGLLRRFAPRNDGFRIGCLKIESISVVPDKRANGSRERAPDDRLRERDPAPITTNLHC